MPKGADLPIGPGGEVSHTAAVDDASDLVSRLVQLDTVDFVDVVRRVIRERGRDHMLAGFETHYALAVVVQPTAADVSAREVTFVAYPSSESVEAELSQAGTCDSCGFEAASTAKTAACGVCGSPVGLTLRARTAVLRYASLVARHARNRGMSDQRPPPSDRRGSAPVGSRTVSMMKPASAHVLSQVASVR